MKTGSLLFPALLLPALVSSFVPFIDGGKGMPKLYDGWFNDQVAKQASAAVGRAISAGKKKIEVNFPPVPNVEGMHAGAVLDLVFRPSPVDRSFPLQRSDLELH